MNDVCLILGYIIIIKFKVMNFTNVTYFELITKAKKIDMI